MVYFAFGLVTSVFNCFSLTFGWQVTHAASNYFFFHTYYFISSDIEECRVLLASIIQNVINNITWLSFFLFSYQGGGDINGKLDEGAAGLILDTKPSKVVSDERTVSSSIYLLHFSVSASYE